MLTPLQSDVFLDQHSSIFVSMCIVLQVHQLLFALVFKGKLQTKPFASFIKMDVNFPFLSDIDK